MCFSEHLIEEKTGAQSHISIDKGYIGNVDETVKSTENAVFAICDFIITVGYRAKKLKTPLFTKPSMLAIEQNIIPTTILKKINHFFQKTVLK